MNSESGVALDIGRVGFDSQKFPRQLSRPKGPKDAVNEAALSPSSQKQSKGKQLTPKTARIVKAPSKEALPPGEEEFMDNLVALRERQKAKEAALKAGNPPKPGENPWRSVPTFGISNSYGVIPPPSPLPSYLEIQSKNNFNTPISPPRTRNWISQSMPNIAEFSRPPGMGSLAATVHGQGSRSCPKNPVLCTALQDVHKNSDGVINTPHPRAFMPRKRGMSVDVTRANKSRIRIMTPREWTNANEEGSAVKWSDFTAPRHTDSMIFAFPHVFNMEFGGEFHDAKDVRFALSDFRADEVKKFLVKTRHQVVLVNHRTLGHLAICVEEGSTSPTAIVFHRDGITIEKVHATDQFSTNPIAYAQNIMDKMMRTLRTNTDSFADLRRRSESDITETKKKPYVVLPSSDAKLKTALLRFLEIVFPERYKIGVLRMPAGKSYEDELFKIDTVSKEFTDFLALFTEEGSRINGRYVANYNGSHILFHCGPFISMSSERFISHDTVVIVFKEGASDDVFVPSNKSSHKTQVYIVVSSDPNRDGSQGYRVQVATKLRLEQFPPYLPPNGHFDSGADLKNFLLGKVINGARVGSRAAGQVSTTLEATLQNALNPYLA